MAGEVGAEEVLNILGGGTATEGNHIFFTLQLRGGPATFACNYMLLPRLVGNLMTYAKMAEEDRTKAPAGSLVRSSPYKVVGVISSGQSDDAATIGLVLETTEGVPIHLAMSREEAEKTIASLQMELAGGRKPHAPH